MLHWKAGRHVFAKDLFVQSLFSYTCSIHVCTCNYINQYILVWVQLKRIINNKNLRQGKTFVNSKHFCYLRHIIMFFPYWYSVCFICAVAREISKFLIQTSPVSEPVCKLFVRSLKTDNCGDLKLQLVLWLERFVHRTRCILRTQALLTWHTRISFFIHAIPTCCILNLLAIN